MNTSTAWIGSLADFRYDGLKGKGKKCDLLRREGNYLGNVVSENGIAVKQDKVKRVISWSMPKNASELRSFVDLASYLTCDSLQTSQRFQLPLTGKEAGKVAVFKWGSIEIEKRQQIKN